MFKKYLLTISILISSISIGYSQSLISEELEENIKARIDNKINAGIVIGILDENGAHFYNYGVKSFETNEPVDENSIFEIGSISKTFTGILLGKNVIDGKMNLDDPLQKYLPEGVVAPTYEGADIHLRHMINHTSSLPRMPDNFKPANPNNPYVDYTEKLMYEFLSSCKLERQIGSEYEYSNFAMSMMGHLLATKSGMSYEDLMVKVICDPLGMENTRVVFTPNMQKNLAIGHDGSREVENWDLGIQAGAGGIRSSTVDMLKYLEANMGKTDYAYNAAMDMSHVNTRVEGAEPRVGLAWHLQKLGDKDIVAHSGATGGYRAYAGFIKGGNKAVVVMTNSTSRISDIGQHLLNPESPLNTVKIPLANALMPLIDEKGVDAAIKVYWDLKKNKADDYDFSESELNNLGYQYFAKDELDIALAIFDLNVQAYPEAFNTYDSRGEAYLKMGEKEKGIADYKKSIELNPGNTNGIKVLEGIGVDTKDLVAEPEIAEEILESYVGKYELAPGFVLDVTREGSQMSAQATGQPKFPIFAKSENTFYLKVVTAELTFNKADEGNIESVTLFQGGNKMTGKRLKE